MGPDYSTNWYYRVFLRKRMISSCTTSTSSRSTGTALPRDTSIGPLQVDYFEGYFTCQDPQSRFRIFWTLLVNLLGFSLLGSCLFDFIHIPKTLRLLAKSTRLFSWWLWPTRPRKRQKDILESLQGRQDHRSNVPRLFYCRNTVERRLCCNGVQREPQLDVDRWPLCYSFGNVRVNLLGLKHSAIIIWMGAIANWVIDIDCIQNYILRFPLKLI